MKITQDVLKNPDKLYIVAAECLLVDQFKHFYIIFIQAQRYLDVFAHIRDFLEHHHFYYFCGAYVEFLCEGTLWGRVWMKQTLMANWSLFDKKWEKIIFLSMFF